MASTWLPVTHLSAGLDKQGSSAGTCLHSCSSITSGIDRSRLVPLADYLAAVDLFMAADKIPVGADLDLSWQPTRDKEGLCVKLPLEVGGELHGQFLEIQSYNNNPTLRFHISIVMEQAICRLDYDLYEAHANSEALAFDDIPGIVNGPHFHPWEMNRRFVTSPKKLFRLRNAEPYTASRQFDSSLRWFCSRTRIKLPPVHRIFIPIRDKLL